MMYPLEVKDLNKFYGGNQSANNLSFYLDEGEIFGMIGPDGSGKTIIIRILVTLLTQDSGTVLFQGRSINENVGFVRSNIGYMPERFSLYRDLTVEQNLLFFGDLFGVPKNMQKQRIEKLYEFSRLEKFNKRLAGDLSGGMKQKLALCCVLIHEPKLLVLDEPTVGVDPVARQEFWDILHQLKQKGTSIFVTTAYMDEASLCDRVALIYDGTFLAVDKPANIVKKFNYTIYYFDAPQPYKVFQILNNTELNGQVQLFGSGIHIIDRKNIGSEKIRKILTEQKIQIKELKIIPPNLEDVFLDLMSARKAVR